MQNLGLRSGSRNRKTHKNHMRPSSTKLMSKSSKTLKDLRKSILDFLFFPQALHGFSFQLRAVFLSNYTAVTLMSKKQGATSQAVDGRLQDPPCNLKRKIQCRKRSKPTFTHGFAFGNALRPAYQISQAWLNEAKTPAQWKPSPCRPTWTVALCYDTSCSVVMFCYMIWYAVL